MNKNKIQSIQKKEDDPFMFLRILKFVRDCSPNPNLKTIGFGYVSHEWGEIVLLPLKRQ